MTILKNIFIIAAQGTIDNEILYGEVDQLRIKAKQLGLTEISLQIDPLRVGWDTPILNHHFRSGNGPLEAIGKGIELLETGLCDFVVISGEDKLRSSYTKEERNQMMQIYQNTSLTELYTKLASLWCKMNHLSHDDFILLADLLFQNYYRSYSNYYSKTQHPDSKWFNFITKLFRGVDCANPLADFSGMLILANNNTINKLGLSCRSCIKIKGFSTQTIDEPNINKIVSYEHLHLAYTKACNIAKLDFLNLFLKKKAYLEIYTCFPIVPLAFLFRLNFTCDLQSTIDLLANYPITLAGGMNLAKAPWNNPVLVTIIRIYHQLKQPNSLNFAGIHSNGGLGEKQGFLILEALEENYK